MDNSGTRCSQKYIVKSAPPHRLDNERAILKTLGHQSGVRRLVDDIQNPPLLVLQYYDDNLLNCCRTKSVEGRELKTVAKTVLQALAALHNQGLVHTGMYSIYLAQRHCPPVTWRLIPPLEV